MSLAEYVEFNGEWHKDCGRCKTPFGASSLDGLRAFFYRVRAHKDGLSNTCKSCERIAKKTKPSTYRPKLKDQKWQARMKVNNALVKGTLEKPDKCEKCQKPSKIIDGHHRDYSKPLDVMWLCRQCHKEEHECHPT